MDKYLVSVPITGYSLIEVIANSEREAIDQIFDYPKDHDFLGNIIDYEIHEKIIDLKDIERVEIVAIEKSLIYYAPED